MPLKQTPAVVEVPKRPGFIHINRGKGTNVRIRSKEIGIGDHVTTEYILNLLKRNSVAIFRQLYAVVGNQSGCFRVPEIPLNHIGIIFWGVTTV